MNLQSDVQLGKLIHGSSSEGLQLADPAAIAQKPVRHRVVPKLEQGLTVLAVLRNRCNYLQRFALALYLPGLKADVSREFR
jgi:hypothetical protein